VTSTPECACDWPGVGSGGDFLGVEAYPMASFAHISGELIHFVGVRAGVVVAMACFSIFGDVRSLRRSPSSDVCGNSMSCRTVLAGFVFSWHSYICEGIVVRDCVVEEVSGIVGCVHSRRLRWRWYRDGFCFAVAFVS